MHSNEKSSKVYTTEVITNILGEEGGKLFDARSVQLGHTLQGGVPSPRDRTRAVRFAVRCLEFLEQHACGADVAADPRLRPIKASETTTKPVQDDVAVLCIQGAAIRFVGLKEMEREADWKNRRGKTAWWQPLAALVDLISGREPEPSFEEAKEAVRLPFWPRRQFSEYED